jgi:hypothetical protein
MHSSWSKIPEAHTSQAVKDLWGVIFSHQLAGKPEIKNLGNVTPDLVISQSASRRKQAYVRQS